jgi:hypothetical protein
MGWSHSVYLAQTAHEHVMECGDMLSVSEPLTRQSVDAVSARSVRVQTYIDDTVFYGLSESVVRSVQ